MRAYRATPSGHAKSVAANQLSGARTRAAARWAYENGYTDDMGDVYEDAYQYD